jgi:hypothetical protein
VSDLPKVLATSVIRSTFQGESHGGVYLIDLRSGDREQVVDWDDPAISWEGRGADRGLRGIAFYDEQVFIAASDEIFVYDQGFKIIDSFKNSYLKHCHEVYRAGDMLWLTSTGFDSVLGFDLKAGRFSIGHHLTRRYPNRVAKRLRLLPRYSVRSFDPEGAAGPQPVDSVHVNNVWVLEKSSVLLSGTGLRHMLRIADGRIHRFARVPAGTHNAQPFRAGLLANHTARNHIAYINRGGLVSKSFPIEPYRDVDLVHSSLPTDHARQAFGRGLCTWKGQLVIGGSSPATVSAFDFNSGECIARVTISMDIRNAIHGLEVWPF